LIARHERARDQADDETHDDHDDDVHTCSLRFGYATRGDSNTAIIAVEQQAGYPALVTTDCLLF
jgi:hypothetical protein